MNIAVIFAGGVGRRMSSGDLPKQFLKMDGKEIIVYTLEVFEHHPLIEGIIVVCIEKWIPHLNRLIEGYGLDKVISVTPGGKTGQESIYNGLEEAGKHYGEDNIVLIHDGVRPLIDQETITRCIECTKEKGSAITISPAIETIIQVEEGQRVKHIIERSQCLLARAPQTFYLKDILAAHRKAIEEGAPEFIDSASIMNYYDYPLYTVEGPVENIKITTPMDYHLFQGLWRGDRER